VPPEQEQGRRDLVVVGKDDGAIVVGLEVMTVVTRNGGDNRVAGAMTLVFIPIYPSASLKSIIGPRRLTATLEVETPAPVLKSTFVLIY
jgi:hypothetical protein